MEEKKESSNCLFPLRNNFFLERARYGNKQSTWVQCNNILLIIIIIIIIIIIMLYFIYIVPFPRSPIALYNNYNPK